MFIFKTGETARAGTDADINIQLIGEHRKDFSETLFEMISNDGELEQWRV